MGSAANSGPAPVRSQRPTRPLTGDTPATQPARGTSSEAGVGVGRFAPAGLLAASAILLAIAPLFMPEGYSVVEQTTSESAAQLVEGSWVARTGFLCFGFAALWLARLRRRRWGAAGTLAHRLFGVSMIATAAFASRPWDPAAPWDETEDLLHSVTSFGVGLGFILGVLLVGMHRGRATGRPRWGDVVALVLVAGTQVAMTAFPDVEGLLQRAMFLIAYCWYGAEAVDSARTTPAAVPAAGRDA
jgi:uncharacterized membrane protein YhaH (DUF805 family)